MQAELPAGHSGSRTGLYDFYVNPDVNVFVGCGLGGTSLINGSVAAKPEPRVFEDPAWPAVLREDLASLEEGFQRANEMLRPAQYPERYPDLPKLDALKQAASMLGQQCSRATIAVNFDAGLNHVGVEQHACMLCGDCVTGCNYGAKNTLIYNYLPDARNFGAEIYTRTAVRQIERKEGRCFILNPDDLRLEVAIADRCSPLVKPSMKLDVRIDAIQQTVTGTLDEVAPEIDPKTRTRLIKISLPKTNGLQHGQFGWLSLGCEAEQQALLVPASAILHFGELQAVKILEGGQTHIQHIRTGKRYGDKLEVLSGLHDGDTILLESGK